ELGAKRRRGAPAGRMDAEGELPRVGSAGPLVDIDVARAVLVSHRRGQAVPALGNGTLQALRASSGDDGFGPSAVPAHPNQLVGGAQDELIAGEGQPEDLFVGCERGRT